VRSAEVTCSGRLSYLAYVIHVYLGVANQAPDASSRHVARGVGVRPPLKFVHPSLNFNLDLSSDWASNQLIVENKNRDVILPRVN